VLARPGAPVAAVLGQEDADVVPLGSAGDERRLHVHDRRVAHERARVDDTPRKHLEGRDRDVVRRAVVYPAREVVDAGLGEPRDGSREQGGESYSQSHGGDAYRERYPRSKGKG